MKLNWDNSVSARCLHSAWCTVAAAPGVLSVGNRVVLGLKCPWGCCCLPGISGLDPVSQDTKLSPLRSSSESTFQNIVPRCVHPANSIHMWHCGPNVVPGSHSENGWSLLTHTGGSQSGVWAPVIHKGKLGPCEQIRTCIYLYCWDFLVKSFCVICMPVNSIIYK